MPIRAGIKDRSHIFAKAEEYLEKIDEQLDELDDAEKNISSTTNKEHEKLRKDFMEAESAVQVVSACDLVPAEMEQQKTEELRELVTKNNTRTLSDEAIVKFLTILYTHYDHEFENFENSWNSALTCVHGYSNNQRLVGLIDELFDVQVQ